MLHADYVNRIRTIKLLVDDERHISLRNQMTKLYDLERSINNGTKVSQSKRFKERLQNCQRQIEYLIKVIEEKK